MQKNVLVGFGIILVGVFLMFNMFYDGHDATPMDINYEGLVKLGLMPNANSRMPTERDINTGVIMTDGQHNYLLFDSRELKEGDYGKGFVVKIN